MCLLPDLSLRFLTPSLPLLFELPFRLSLLSCSLLGLPVPAPLFSRVAYKFSLPLTSQSVRLGYKLVRLAQPASHSRISCSFSKALLCHYQYHLRCCDPSLSVETVPSPPCFSRSFCPSHFCFSRVSRCPFQSPNARHLITL